MKSQIRSILLVAAALVVGLPALALAERFELTGETVAIYNIVGEVEIVPGTGNSVVVDVTTVAGAISTRPSRRKRRIST